MHTVDLLVQALATARRMGFKIREDWLDGNGGGGCVLHGQKWIFIDLAVDPHEQLERVADTLLEDPAIHKTDMPAELQAFLGVRRSA